MEGRIRIFFGAHLNVPNAQNLNCKALVEELDESKFFCYSLIDFEYPIEQSLKDKRNVKLFFVRRPKKCFNILGYIWGIYHCHIAYLPKHDLIKLVKTLLFIFQKKSLKTIEIVINENTFNLVKEKFGISRKKFRRFFKGFTQLYSITNYIKEMSCREENLGLHSKGPLLLGTKIEKKIEFSEKRNIKNIIFIGIDSKRKGIEDFISISREFPKINFNIIGGFCDEIEIACRRNSNLNFLGVLNHKSVLDILEQQDILILPSRNEGFPKVILEAGSLFVPSIVYADYGMNEFITNGINGFVVETRSQIVEKICFLQNNVEQFNFIRKNCFKLSEEFKWENVIKEWEKIFIEIYNLD